MTPEFQNKTCLYLFDVQHNDEAKDQIFYSPLNPKFKDQYILTHNTLTEVLLLNSWTSKK